MHVGKLYPYAPRWFQPDGMHPRRLPPRRLVAFNFASGGTVGSMWGALEHISNPAEQANDPNLLWVVPNSLWPTTELRLRIGYADTPPSTGFLGPLCWTMRCEVWYLGSLLTYADGYRQVSNAWDFPGESFRCPLSGTTIWEMSPSPTLWNGGYFTFRNGSWDESPEYHPYRH